MSSSNGSNRGNDWKLEAIAVGAGCLVVVVVLALASALDAWLVGGAP